MKFHSKTVIAALGITALAACSPDVDQPQAEEGAEMIQCALGKGSEFGPDCLVERTDVDGERQLIVRHPDGGFRRFAQLEDGRGLVELDGADQLVRTLEGGTLEVSIGVDRYRFVANVRGDDNGADAAAE